MTRNKNARKRYQVPLKQPRVTNENQALIQNSNEHPLVWQLKILDFEHNQWGWNNLDGDTFSEIISKLKNYESMTWNEIQADKSRDHVVPFDQLDSKAKKRLTELKLDEYDGLSRLRLTGTQRIWGIRDRNIFKILWWDPYHSVCPSIKKHT